MKTNRFRRAEERTFVSVFPGLRPKVDWFDSTATQFIHAFVLDDIATSVCYILKMKQVSYKDYIIRVTNAKENGSWRSHVTITWYAGKFDLHDEVCFPTEIEAEEHGLELGKHWVNNRIQCMQRLP